MTEPDDLVEVVRRGYDALSERYRTDDAPTGQYTPWLADVVATVPSGGRVLDLGCGNGVTVARDLAAAGLVVTGVDVSEVQVRRACALVPAATFVRADVSGVTFPAASFDAVVAFYSLVHVPLARQPGLLAELARWLVPDGLFLATVGHTAWTGTEPGWLGGEATMAWSHADAATYREWVTAAGLEVTDETFVPEGDSGHVLVRALRRRDAT